MQGPKISIIIPAYNVENYLARCLDSCAEQTLYDIEIICVDDGSTDRTGKIADLYAARDPRFRIIHKQNGGVSAARNTGLREARGEWIMFADADDFLSENACERVWRESLEGPTEIIVYGAHIFPTYPGPGKWYHYVLNIYTHRENAFTPRVLFETPCSKPFIWHKAFSAGLLKDAEIAFDETVALGEDLIFLMEIFPQAKYFAFIPDKLYHYRWIRPNSAMQQAKEDTLKRLEHHVEVLEKICGIWRGKGWLEKYAVPYTAWYIDFLVPDLLKEECGPEKKHEIAGRILAVANEYRLSDCVGKLGKRKRRLWKQLKQL